ncbi:AT-rich interactive domain-containing protein 1-like isoform X2 [Rutidosis leptorrhynchoides]|uniref:AT-rich interactive domain-containing protein 1-like isoform X2 n=1 Tax=Rutidosis leptorrhynchoides TaxID=125765 RepID=UPI003A9980D6
MDLGQLFMEVDITDEKNLGFNDVGIKVCCGGEKNEVCVGIEEEKEVIRKRKKECYLPLLHWVKHVAKNPCDPAIGSIPEKPSKWKAYGNEHVWKQVLLAKEAMRLKVNDDSNGKQSVWQKKLKMHPDMYNNQTKNPNSRCSQRLVSVKVNQSMNLSRKLLVRDYSESSSTGSPSDADDADSFWATDYRRKRIPLGRSFQAEVPQWVDVKPYESETKWLGTRIWPLEPTEKRSSLIEREPIGKGRQGSCGCQIMGSLECVRFHVAEKRSRVKLELGTAFLKWKFDTIGEDVSLKWDMNEEKMFSNIIKLNPESSGRSFWVELVTYFKNKPRTVLVSYYFNVYMLRRRAHQNRADPSNIDSDDDELEKVGSGLNQSIADLNVAVQILK